MHLPQLCLILVVAPFSAHPWCCFVCVVPIHDFPFTGMGSNSSILEPWLCLHNMGTICRQGGVSGKKKKMYQTLCWSCIIFVLFPTQKLISLGVALPLTFPRGCPSDSSDAECFLDFLAFPLIAFLALDIPNHTWV